MWNFFYVEQYLTLPRCRARYRRVTVLPFYLALWLLLTFNGIQKTYENYYSFTYKKNEIVLDKAIYVGFAILELSKLHMYETYYDTLQPYFDQENLQLHYIDTDGMILSMKTKDIIKDLKNLEDIFDFSNLDEKHELFSNKNKKVIGKFKIETPKNIWIDEFVCLNKSNILNSIWIFT